MADDSDEELSAKQKAREEKFTEVQLEIRDSFRELENMIDRTLERGENLEELEEEAYEIRTSSLVFHKASRKLSWKMWFREQKMYLILAFVILVVLAIGAYEIYEQMEKSEENDYGDLDQID
jgi:hypothetical protein